MKKYILLLSLLSITTAHAERSKTLDEYIGKLCNKNCVSSHRLKKAVKKVNKKYRLPKHLLMAVLKTESKFKKTAYNSGNYGLMQINKSSHPDKVKGKDLYSVETNIDVGARILSDCLKKHHSFKETLVCYKHNEVPKYQKEVKKAMVILASFHE